MVRFRASNHHDSPVPQNRCHLSVRPESRILRNPTLRWAACKRATDGRRAHVVVLGKPDRQAMAHVIYRIID